MKKHTLLCICFAALVGYSCAEKPGIAVADMDRTADPAQDFYPTIQKDEGNQRDGQLRIQTSVEKAKSCASQPKIVRYVDDCSGGTLARKWV